MLKPFVRNVEERKVPEKMSAQKVPNVLIWYTAAAGCNISRNSRYFKVVSINTECLLFHNKRYKSI